MKQDYDFEIIRDQAIAALRERYQNASIKAAEGWHGRVHIKIVSPEFDGLTETDRQNAVWEVLRERLGPAAEGVSLVLPFGMDEV